MMVGVPRESFPGERRVALVPAGVATLTEAGCTVLLQSGAGLEAGFPDDDYRAKGAEIVPSRADVFARAELILQVRGPGANPSRGREDLESLRSGQVTIGFQDPLSAPQSVRDLASKDVTAFAMELLPRTTRAQSMDALSSMATVAGYRAVLLAATTLPRMFPMMMTAAGTITPARVLVVGAGVAGLQAIATARRLGAIVKAYDVRAAVKEQVESLGARFVELPLESAEGTGGYARAQDEEFLRKQRELMAEVVAESNVVITTAAIPGKKSPVLVTEEMVKGMAPSSVIVDLAAERGGNCELTRADETVSEHGVTILGPTDLASRVPYHASQMYSKNITTFLLHLMVEGSLHLDRDDDIIRETLLSRKGQVVHQRIQEALGKFPATVSDGKG